MDYIDAHRLRTSFAPALAAVCLLCASAMPQAGDLSSPGQANRRNALPLQFSFSLARPLTQNTPAQPAGNPASPEDCDDEEDIVPVVSIPHAPPAKAAPPASPPAVVSEPVLAKLEPAAQLKENRIPPPAPPAPAPATNTQLVKAAPPAPATQVEPAPQPKPDPVWEISLADKTLSVTLGRWAQTAGWQLLWELPVDYTIEARTAVPGTFEEAVEAVISSMEAADTAMHAIFYKGNKVLRIVAKGRE